MIDEERVGAEREPDDGEPEPVDDRDPDLVGREVERADHGQRRPFPEQRAAARRPRQRRDHDHAERAEQHAADVEPAALDRCAQADRRAGRRSSRRAPQIPSIRNAAIATAASSAVAGPALTGSEPVREVAGEQVVDRARERELHRAGRPGYPGRAARRSGAALRDELEEVGVRRQATPTGSDVVGPEGAATRPPPARRPGS